MAPIEGCCPAVLGASGFLQTASMMSVAVIVILATAWTALHPDDARARAERALGSLDRLPVLRLLQQLRDVAGERTGPLLPIVSDSPIMVAIQSDGAPAWAGAAESSADERPDVPTIVMGQRSSAVLWLPSRSPSPMLSRRASPSPEDTPLRTSRGTSVGAALLSVPVAASVYEGPITPAPVSAPALALTIEEKEGDSIGGLTVGVLPPAGAASEGGECKEPGTQAPAAKTSLASFPRTPVTEPILGPSDGVRGNERRRVPEAVMVAA